MRRTGKTGTAMIHATAAIPVPSAGEASSGAIAIAQPRTRRATGAEQPYVDARDDDDEHDPVHDEDEAIDRLEAIAVTLAPSDVARIVLGARA